MSKTARKNWTPEQVAELYQRTGRVIPPETLRVIESLGLQAHLRPEPLSAKAESGSGESVKLKRQGVDVKPILASLRAPLVQVAIGEGPTLSLWFEGARLLTINELFSILQYRKHETFAYKKAWKKQVATALDALPADRVTPYFDGPTRLTLYRRGSRKVDLDSMPAMFKYAIDALRPVRRTRKLGGGLVRKGIIPDDNPDIIVEIQMLQEVGEPALALHLERLPNWQPPHLENLRERWMGRVGWI